MECRETEFILRLVDLCKSGHVDLAQSLWDQRGDLNDIPLFIANNIPVLSRAVNIAMPLNGDYPYDFMTLLEEVFTRRRRVCFDMVDQWGDVERFFIKQIGFPHVVFYETSVDLCLLDFMDWGILDFEYCRVTGVFVNHLIDTVMITKCEGIDYPHSLEMLKGAKEILSYGSRSKK